MGLKLIKARGLEQAFEGLLRLFFLGRVTHLHADLRIMLVEGMHGDLLCPCASTDDEALEIVISKAAADEWKCSIRSGVTSV